MCSGFPVAHFKGDRFGLVVAYWGLALTLGVPQVSQTDYTNDGQTFGERLTPSTAQSPDSPLACI